MADTASLEILRGMRKVLCTEGLQGPFEVLPLKGHGFLISAVDGRPLAQLDRSEVAGYLCALLNLIGPQKGEEA